MLMKKPAKTRDIRGIGFAATAKTDIPEIDIGGEEICWNFDSIGSMMQPTAEKISSLRGFSDFFKGQEREILWREKWNCVLQIILRHWNY